MHFLRSSCTQFLKFSEDSFGPARKRMPMARFRLAKSVIAQHHAQVRQLMDTWTTPRESDRCAADEDYVSAGAHRLNWYEPLALHSTEECCKIVIR